MVFSIKFSLKFVCELMISYGDCLAKSQRFSYCDKREEIVYSNTLLLLLSVFGDREIKATEFSCILPFFFSFCFYCQLLYKDTCRSKKLTYQMILLEDIPQNLGCFIKKFIKEFYIK